MSFHERTTLVTLTSFSLILAFFVFRIVQLVQNDRFVNENVFWLWGNVAILAVGATIVAIILTHIGAGVVEKARTGQAPRMDDVRDERDVLIDLKGTQLTYRVTSMGSALAMLAYVLGQPALVMFSLLICVGLFGQIVGDFSRLYRYRKGFSHDQA